MREYLQRFSSSNGQEVRFTVTEPEIFDIESAVRGCLAQTGLIRAFMRTVAVRADYMIYRAVAATGAFDNDKNAPSRDL